MVRHAASDSEEFVNLGGRRAGSCQRDGFEDGLTIISLTVGFIAALALLNGTFVQLYTMIFGMLPGLN